MTTYLRTSELRFSEIGNVLETIISIIKNIIIKAAVSEDEVTGLKDLLGLFFINIFDVNFLRRKRTEFLTRLLTALVTFPIECKADKGYTLSFYESLNIINKVTFLIFQTRQISFPKKYIAGFLEYIKGDESFNYYALLFYRVNPEYIKAVFELRLVDVSAKELYYGIESGYFAYIEERSESYERLVELVRSYPRDDMDYGSKKSDSEDESTHGDNITPVIEVADEDTFIFNPLSVLRLLWRDGFISKRVFILLIDFK